MDFNSGGGKQRLWYCDKERNCAFRLNSDKILNIILEKKVFRYGHSKIIQFHLLAAVNSRLIGFSRYPVDTHYWTNWLLPEPFKTGEE